MKIAFFELKDWEKDFFKHKLKNHELSFCDEPLSDQTKDLIDAEIVSTFIYSKVNSETLLKNMPSLKFVTTRSTGFDHIDVRWCKTKDIQVSNVPSYGENTVAEHTFALLLALSRKLVPSIEETKLGIFDLSTLQGFDLKDKTIGVIGTGKIGAHVVRMAHGFEMRIKACDVTQNTELIDKYGVVYENLDDLLASSDIITIHLPLNKKTEHLINSDNISKIKKGAYIINTARGGLIETTALAKALQDSTVAGVGLDVLEGESDIKEEWQLISDGYSKKRMTIDLANNVIIKDPRVIVTPHNAFNSKEALQRILDTTLLNIESFDKGAPINLVN